jgi:hypothetical protein
MAGMEFMELSQTCGFHMFDVFDTIPFQPLQLSCPPTAPSTLLHCFGKPTFFHEIKIDTPTLMNAPIALPPPIEKSMWPH